MIYIVLCIFLPGWRSSYWDWWAWDDTWYTMYRILCYVLPVWWWLWCDMIYNVSSIVCLVMYIILPDWWCLLLVKICIVSCIMLPGGWCLWHQMIYIATYFFTWLMVLVMWHDIHCIVYRVTWLMAFWAASFSCFRSRISLFSLSSFFLASFSVFWSWYSNNLSDKQPKNVP